MTLILNIETATTACSVCLAKDGIPIALKEQNGEYSHSENLTLFIQNVFEESNSLYKDLDAVAVSMGPGSYTGLRIGVSVAKGLCYALDKPLIAVNTLQHMALSVSSTNEYSDIKKNSLFCPMIDARRMEVYYSVFDVTNKEVLPIAAEIVNENSFSDLLDSNYLYFFGNGAAKCKNVFSDNKNAFFINNIELSAKSMTTLSNEAFNIKRFQDVTHFEPFLFERFFNQKI